VASLVMLSAMVPAHADGPILTAQAPIPVPGVGHFDFIQFDAEKHRLLACHPGAKQLDIVDVKTGQVTAIDTGDVNGVAVDAADNRYYTAGPGQDIVVIDRTTLAKVADIPTSGPCDDVLYEPKSGMVYVAHDDGTEDWVVDPKTNKITGSVAIAGAPEVMTYSVTSDRVYQNIKPTNQVQVIDPSTNTVVSTWSTVPAESPHGLAFNAKRNCLYSAGKNGTLAAIDIANGHSAGSCDIANGVDQIVFDPNTDRVYCACSGVISVVRPSDEGVTRIGDVPITGVGHCITVDPTTGSVWIASGDDKGSFVQEFRPGS